MVIPPMNITILGSGDAKGVPRLGCSCKICQVSYQEKNKNYRTRPSIFLQERNLNILIDTAPEIRLQTAAQKIKRIDIVIFSHDHADHILGYDDLVNFNRLLNKKMAHSLEIYASKKTLSELNCRFPYIKNLVKYYQNISSPQLTIKTFSSFKKFNLVGWNILPIKISHGPGYLYAFKFTKKNKTFVYIPDIIKSVSDKIIKKLANCDLLIIGADKFDPKKTPKGYLNLEQTIEVIKKIASKKTILIHMSHRIDYYNKPEIITSKILLGYDGMKLKI